MAAGMAAAAGRGLRTPSPKDIERDIAKDIDGDIRRDVEREILMEVGKDHDRPRD
jgi:hypothetical protein